MMRLFFYLAVVACMATPAAAQQAASPAPVQKPPVPAHALAPFACREVRELVAESPAQSKWQGHKVYAVDSWNRTRLVAEGPSKLTIHTSLDVPKGGADTPAQYEIIMSELLPHAQASTLRVFVNGAFLPEEDVFKEVFRKTFESKPLKGVKFKAKSNVGEFMIPTEPQSFEFQVPAGKHVYAFRLGKMAPEVTVWGQAFWATIEPWSDRPGALTAPAETITPQPNPQPLVKQAFPRGSMMRKLQAMQQQNERTSPTAMVDMALYEGPPRVGGLYRAVFTAKFADGSTKEEVRWLEPKALGPFRVEVELWDKQKYLGSRPFELPIQPQATSEPFFVIGMYEQTDGTVMRQVNGDQYRLNSAFSARRHHRPAGSDPILARQAYEKTFSGIAQLGANTVLPFLEVVPDHYPQYLEAARRKGLKVIMSTEDLMHFLLGSRTRGAFPTNEEIYQEARTNVERLHTFPNLLQYAVGDEPDMDGIAVLDRVVKIYAALDPDHPLYIPFIANKGEEGSLSEFVRRLAPYRPPQVAVDWYPAFKDLKPGGFVEDTAQKMWGSGQAYARMGVNWWYIAQAFGNHLVWRWPTSEEYRFTIHAALACGAKGVLNCLISTSGPENNQFEYPIEGLVAADGSKRPLWSEVQRLNGYMSSIGPLMMQLTFRGTEFAECKASKGLVASHTDAGGKPYLYLVNKSITAPQELEVKVKKPGATQAILIPGLQRIPIEQSKFKYTLDPGAGALFSLE
jgi:hypothetical protein